MQEFNENVWEYIEDRATSLMHECPSGWIDGGVNMGCFFFGEQHLSWNDSLHYCQSIFPNSWLVEIPTEEAQDILFQTMHITSGTQAWWLGATATNGKVSNPIFDK